MSTEFSTFFRAAYKNRKKCFFLLLIFCLMVGFLCRLSFLEEIGGFLLAIFMDLTTTTGGTPEVKELSTFEKKRSRARVVQPKICTSNVRSL